MSENLRIIHRRLAYLTRLRADLEYSVGKMTVPLEKVRTGDIAIEEDADEFFSVSFAAASSVRGTPTYRRLANTGRTGSAAT